MPQSSSCRAQKCPPWHRSCSHAPETWHLSSKPLVRHAKSFQGTLHQGALPRLYGFLAPTRRPPYCSTWSQSPYGTLLYISTAWDSVKQATISNCGGNIWPDWKFLKVLKLSQKYEKQCQNQKAYCTANAWRGFPGHEEGTREEIWGETAAEPTNQGSDETAEKGFEVSDDEDGVSQPWDCKNHPLCQQPRWRNGLQPWKKFSMTWKWGPRAQMPPHI